MALHTQPSHAFLQTLMEKRVARMLTPLENFVRKQVAASALLALATLLALIIANSPWQTLSSQLIKIEAGFHIDRFAITLPLETWVNDGLLALFFFLIGLELKREILAGQLQHLRQIGLIILAAIGGMLLPALIYWAINHNGAGAIGWAIPMATDTAFAMGALAVIARYVSIHATVFFAALAIFDDIGSIVVIAFYYTEEMHFGALLYGAIPFTLLYLLNIAGIRRGWIYAILGIWLWFHIYQSGIHATLAGILVALAIPARSRINQRSFIELMREQLFSFEKEGKQVDKAILSSSSQHLLTENIEETIKAAHTPLQRWHTLFENPVGMLVLPIFALVNGGVELSMHHITDAMHSPITWGIIAGLVMGKPIGILLFSLLALKLKLGKLPPGMHFSELIGIGIFAGIGFTMSVFITTLSFDSNPAFIEQAKIGILFSSLISATAGILWFRKMRQL